MWHVSRSTQGRFPTKLRGFKGSDVTVSPWTGPRQPRNSRTGRGVHGSTGGLCVALDTAKVVVLW